MIVKNDRSGSPRGGLTTADTDSPGSGPTRVVAGRNSGRQDCDQGLSSLAIAGPPRGDPGLSFEEVYDSAPRQLHPDFNAKFRHGLPYLGASGPSLYSERVVLCAWISDVAVLATGTQAFHGLRDHEGCKMKAMSCATKGPPMIAKQVLSTTATLRFASCRLPLVSVI